MKPRPPPHVSILLMPHPLAHSPMPHAPCPMPQNEKSLVGCK
ncbi:hypothetical protein [Nostoc linckia]|nr:hypothetical protein [Nostoc linckia]